MTQIMQLHTEGNTQEVFLIASHMVAAHNSQQWAAIPHSSRSTKCYDKTTYEGFQLYKGFITTSLLRDKPLGA